MLKPLRLSLLTAILAASACGAAHAESLSCRSVNGNVTCVGSGAMSCQTVNGQTTCIGGNGAVVQRFGGAPLSPPSIMPEEAEPEDEAIPLPRTRGGRLLMERRGPGGWMTIERDGTRLRLRSDHLAIDRD